jgi:hypothetical protein
MAPPKDPIKRAEWLEKVRATGLANKGHKDSPETREKRSKSHLGKKMPPRSDEWKKKQSESHKGQGAGRKCEPRSEGWRIKQSKSHKGRVDSKETRRKKSESQMGIPKSTEHRQKIGDGNRGEKSGLWKGGITSLQMSIRTSVKMLAWRKAIFTRDNYTCQSSGKRGNKLEAHHKIPFAELMKIYNITTFEEAMNCEPLWDLNNGITLAKDIHRALHSSLASGKEDEFE